MKDKIQAQTEVPDRPQSLISSLLRVKEDRERKEGARASQRSPEKQRREIPDGSSGEAPESDFFLITRKRRQREEGGGQSQPEEPRGGQQGETQGKSRRRSPRAGRGERDPEGSSGEAPESAGIGFPIVFLWFSFQNQYGNQRKH